MQSQSKNTTITICKPPQAPTYKGKSVFLAGSTENEAKDWRTKLIDYLSIRVSEPLTILDPYRIDWDSKWVEDISNDQFRGQVEWELDAQDNADVIAMYFDPNTLAPISLLELGLYAASGKMVVCCPEGFWKRGNVQVVCARYNIKLVGSMEELIDEVLKKL
jgi:hypothetical protein